MSRFRVLSDLCLPRFPPLRVGKSLSDLRHASSCGRRELRQLSRRQLCVVQDVVLESCLCIRRGPLGLGCRQVANVSGASVATVDATAVAAAPEVLEPR